ncbi:hypothetical protein BDV93DRAFT_563453 [Ceratobasidium sp. AG-I]|nr:hypothetical protein BDV93DRAFT_563453 [Ceratobasidium sp. AG-I]
MVVIKQKLARFAIASVSEMLVRTTLLVTDASVIAQTPVGRVGVCLILIDGSMHFVVVSSPPRRSSRALQGRPGCQEQQRANVYGTGASAAPTC